MAGTDPQDLHALALELLTASEAALNTIPTFAPGLVGAPERSFVSPGGPAADCCPQLTTHVELVQEAPTEPQGLAAGKRYHRINHVGLVVTLFRCVPTLLETKSGFSPPLAVDIEAAAAQINADGWALWNHLFNMRNAELLFTRCGEVFWQGLRSLPQQGGCGGWVLAFLVSLDGYQEVLP